MNELDAIIFDVDGTLADTEETHRQAFNRAFRAFDLDWDWTPMLYEQLLAISGGRERITFYGQDLAKRFPHAGELARYVADIHAVKTRLYAEMLTSGEVPLRPGVRRLIDEARQAGIRLGIATSSAFGNLKTLLDNNLPAHWPDWFAAIHTCDSIPEKKPSPAVYLAVLREFGLAASRCVAIEDTENGLKAATGAGIATVITTHFFTRHHHFPSAALVLDGVGEPGVPFTVSAGSSGDHEYLDVALLNELLERRSSCVAPPHENCRELCAALA